MEALEVAGVVVGIVIGVVWLLLEWQTGVRLRNIETLLRELKQSKHAGMSGDDAAQAAPLPEGDVVVRDAGGDDATVAGGSG